MAEKNFAFESGKVSIAFPCPDTLGDCLIAKKVFDALVELVPDCRIDIFYNSERGKNYVEAFYGQSKNLNCILSFQNFYQQNVRKYDAALRVWHMVLIDFANVERLQKISPALLHCLQGIDAYNKRYVFNTDAVGIILRNITRAHILGINRYTCLSCGGALPIHDNKVEIHLSPEGDRQFKNLGLSKNYITVGSNVGEKNNLARHSLKEWPTACVTEYISLLNIHLPQVAVVQIGGGGGRFFFQRRLSFARRGHGTRQARFEKFSVARRLRERPGSSGVAARNKMFGALRADGRKILRLQRKSEHRLGYLSTVRLGVGRRLDLFARRKSAALHVEHHAANRLLRHVQLHKSS